jgi:hypothetical protein
MGAPSKVSHTGRNAGVGSAVVVIVILLAGFLVYVPVTTMKAVPYLVVSTQTVTYVTSSTTQVPVTQPRQTSSQVYSLTAYTLNCSSSVYLSATLDQGWDLVVSYSAGDTITVYLFNSQEFSSWQSGGNPTPEKSQSGLSSGTFGYSVPLTDTYYLVLDNNLHNGFFCIGGEKVTINYVTGTATYTTQATIYINQVVTYTTSSQTLVTQTSTSTTTQSCSYQFWAWLTGSRSC